MNDLILSKTEQIQEIVEPLLAWYYSERRELPWRESPSPYHVWISEIMLQQTRVEAVKPYFERFTQTLPDIKALAEVPTDSLLKLWEGLGYYSRARNLQKTAQQVCTEHNGRLPDSFEELLKLPGIGRYTAGAISSIAYGKKEPAVDGNVLRIITRLIASHEDILQEKVKRAVEVLLRPILPDKAGDFNQALMDLGAMVCLPKGAAKCSLCPLQKLCLAYDEGLTQELPYKAPKKSRRIEKHTILLLTLDEQAALQRRPAKGLLAGLWELPNLPGHLTQNEIKAYLKTQQLELLSLTALPEAKHIFSHIEWQMIGYHAKIRFAQVKENPSSYGKISNEDGFHWILKEELSEAYAVPTAFKSYIDIFRQS